MVIYGIFHPRNNKKLIVRRIFLGQPKRLAPVARHFILYRVKAWIGG